MVVCLPEPGAPKWGADGDEEDEEEALPSAAQLFLEENRRW